MADMFDNLEQLDLSDIVGGDVNEGTPAPVATEVVSANAPKKTKSVNQASVDAKKEFDKQALAAYERMTDEDKARAGSAANTLLFLGYASLASRKGSYSAGGKNAEGKPNKIVREYAVGTCWESTEPIDVPVISPEYADLTKPIPPEELTKTAHKAPGELFTLNDAEALVLFCRVEYSSNFVLKVNGTKGKVRYKKSVFGGATEKVYPTPAFNLEGCVSHDYNMIIDQKRPDGTWEIKPEPEFQKFAGEIKSGSAPRGGKSSTTSKPSVDKTILDSAAIRYLLFKQ